MKFRKKEGQIFNGVSYVKVFTEIRNLQTSQTTQQIDIPWKILNETLQIFARYFRGNINSIFPFDLKLADITEAFKKKWKILKDNYRTIVILPNL